MIYFLMIFSIIGWLEHPGLQTDEAEVLGKWKVVAVKYLDKKPTNPDQGLNLIFEFKAQNKCVNHKDQSEVTYSISGNKLNMDGYVWIIESLNEQQMVVREDKAFFIRKLTLKKIE